MGLQRDTTDVTHENAQTVGQIRTEELHTVAEKNVKNLGHRDVGLQTRVYFDNFMAISDDEASSRPRYETQESLGIGLDFSCTDIESDGVSSSTHRGDSGDETDSSGNAGSDIEGDSATGGDRAREGDSEMEEKQRRFREGGRLLREFADEIDKEFFENNPAVGAELNCLITHLAEQAADDVFEHTLDKVLEQFNGSFPHHDDKYKVALVMLCTRRSIIAINSALNATKDTSERVIGSAMSYITGHFPQWIDSFR